MSHPQVEIKITLDAARILYTTPRDKIESATKQLAAWMMDHTGDSGLNSVVEYPEIGTPRNVVMLYGGFSEPTDNGWVKVSFSGPEKAVVEALEEFRKVGPTANRSAFLQAASGGNS
jgi:hypothetical protein